MAQDTTPSQYAYRVDYLNPNESGRDGQPGMIDLLKIKENVSLVRDTVMGVLNVTSLNEDTFADLLLGPQGWSSLGDERKKAVKAMIDLINTRQVQKLPAAARQYFPETSMLPIIAVEATKLSDKQVAAFIAEYKDNLIKNHKAYDDYYKTYTLTQGRIGEEVMPQKDFIHMRAFAEAARSKGLADKFIPGIAQLCLEKYDEIVAGHSREAKDVKGGTQSGKPGDQSATATLHGTGFNFQLPPPASPAVAPDHGTPALGEHRSTIVPTGAVPPAPAPIIAAGRIVPGANAAPRGRATTLVMPSPSDLKPSTPPSSPAPSALTSQPPVSAQPPSQPNLSNKPPLLSAPTPDQPGRRPIKTDLSGRTMQGVQITAPTVPSQGKVPSKPADKK